MVAVSNSLKKYWDDKALKLYHKSKNDFSLDENGSKKYNKKATAKDHYVTDLQSDLKTLGYLTGKADGYYGSGTSRAITRFQRHAKRLYRMKKDGTTDDVKTVSYTGAETGVCDKNTATEIRNWVTKSWILPLGRFKLVKVGGARLRSDAAHKWAAAIASIKAKGGAVITNNYGDSLRPTGFRKLTGGNSLYSFHYTGRAVDLNQSLAGGTKQRYYVVKETSGTVYWRIYCKTTKQDGTQGVKITKKKKIKYYSFWKKKEFDMPEAYYIDITAILQQFDFIRIKAHSNWKTNYKATEWWHYHFKKNIQSTFLDEMELIGVSEATLRAKGWNTIAQLDHKPG